VKSSTLQCKTALAAIMTFAIEQNGKCAEQHFQ